ncbi:MAG: hypothetical protein SVY53_11740, partial [Chloroflexota bacterium]|nr:hypothetical protein [Chloroflexota bacterium]
MTKLRSKRKGTIKAGGRSNYYITINRERKSPFAEVEKRFRETMKVPLSQATDIGEADVVVGVPFYSEADTLGYVLETASLGLKEFYPDSRSVIVTAGSPSGSEALKSVTTPAHQKIDQIAFLMEDELLDGKGWSVRAIVEIADRLGADLVILEADLLSRTINGEREGLSPDWIKFLLEPIRKHEADLVISRFNFHHYDGYICKDLAYPLLTALYNQPIPCLLGGQWGIAHSLLRTYLNDTSYAWHADISGYGVDSWLATDAITNGATIWEADLGVKIHRTSGAKADLVLKQVANALFHQIVNHTNWWSKTCDADGLPVQKPLPIVGLQQRKQPDAVEIDLQLLLEKYRNGIYDYQTLYEKVLTQEIYQQLLDLGEIDEEGFNFSSNLWARIIYEFLLAYAFGKGIAKGDLLNSLSPLHDGFTASKVLSMHRLERKLSFLPHEESERLLSLEAQQRTEELVTIFLIQRNGFLDKWREKSVSIEPPLPRVTYREFIPGIPLIVPSEIIGRKGNLVTANGIYDSIFTRHKERFEHYVYEQLHIPREANSLEMSLRIKDYLHTVERHIIPEADLRTVEGTRDAIQTIFNQFPHGKGFALTPEAASHLLGKCPPLALPAKLGHKDLNELLQEYDPCSLLALANWTEEKDYVKVLWETIADEIQPEHFAPRTISFVAVRHEEFPSLVELRNSSSLDKLTATILVSNLHKGMGGWFPKLRYFLAITRDIVE